MPVPDLIKFMQTARERHAFATAADADDRRAAEEDNKFASGGDAQWLPEDINSRKALFRPILTWNRLGVFTAQVVNDGRQKKPAIRISAMDGGSKKTAEFYQSRIRHIEYESSADIAYDTAREQQVVTGRGFYRIRTRFLPNSFRQELRIERIENQFSVFFDPAAVEYDRDDAEWSFVVSQISQDAFERRYGKDRDCIRNNWFQDGQNPAPDWIGVGSSGALVQLAEYWLKEHRKRTLCKLMDGTTCWEDELPGSQTTVVDRREDDDWTVKQYIINGIEILDETEWIGRSIPIIPVWGREQFVDGRRQTCSLIRPAKDPQRLVNLFVSNIAEQIAMMPKAPYMAAEGQITNHEDDWENINVSPKSVILYKALAIGDTVIGAPQRQIHEPPIQALTVGLNQAIDGIKAAMGIFDASLGARSNEQSGIAIQRRAREADNANFHFPDNEARSRRALGRQLLELIPIVDQGDHTVATRGEDGKTKMERVNAPYRDEETGEVVHHDLESGDYGVAASTSPSFTSQRQEAFDTYSQIAQNDKNFMQLAGDILFRNMDAPGSEELADRYEKILPPALQPQKSQGQQQQQQIPQQVQAQMQALMQQHDQLVQVVHQQAEVIESKRDEFDSRERIARMQEETKRVIAFAQMDQRDGLAILQHEVQVIREDQDRVHERDMAAAGQQHEAQLRTGDQQHQANMQDADQAHRAGMQDADQQHQAQLADQQRQAAAAQAQPQPQQPQPQQPQPQQQAA